MPRSEATSPITKMPEYQAWFRIKQRCHHPNHPLYSTHGKAGIRMDPRWRRSFHAFLGDIGPRPSPKHRLNRIDLGKGFNKTNCRWEAKQQKSHVRKITFRGVTLNQGQWARKLNLSPAGLSTRIKRWGVYRALSTGRVRKIYLNEKARKEGRKRTHREWRRRDRKTLRGMLINRLRPLLHHALSGGRTNSLPYASDELAVHIQKKLDARDYACPMCGVSLHEEFDVDHRIPLASAKNDGEIYKLFRLDNLDVLCPDCNRNKKRDKMIDY